MSLMLKLMASSDPEKLADRTGERNEKLKRLQYTLEYNVPQKLTWLNCIPNDVLPYWRGPSSLELGAGVRPPPAGTLRAELWPQGLIFHECFPLGKFCLDEHFLWLLSKINASGKVLMISQNEI